MKKFNRFLKTMVLAEYILLVFGVVGYSLPFIGIYCEPSHADNTQSPISFNENI